MHGIHAPRHALQPGQAHALLNGRLAPAGQAGEQDLRVYTGWEARGMGVTGGGGRQQTPRRGPAPPRNIQRTPLSSPSSRASRPFGSRARTASAVCSSEDSYSARRSSSEPAREARSASSGGKDSSAATAEARGAGDTS